MYWMGKSRKEVLHSKLTTSSILQQFSIKWEKKRGAFQAQCAGELLVGTLFEKYQKKSDLFCEQTQNYMRHKQKSFHKMRILT